MENYQQVQQQHHHSDASRPSLGFPLGTALLIITIFCLSGFFSCCYHWEKLRSLRRSSQAANTDPESGSDGELPSNKIPRTYDPDLKQKQGQSVPVLMPGDNVPKFIAMPCACKPLRPPHENAVVLEVQKEDNEPPAVVVVPVVAPVIVYNQIARFGVNYNG